MNNLIKIKEKNIDQFLIKFNLIFIKNNFNFKIIILKNKNQ